MHDLALRRDPGALQCFVCLVLRRSGLHLSAARGHCSVVDMLVSKGGNLEARDAQMRTPLMKAADSGHLEVVQLLLSNGADPDAFDASGLTSLHVGVHRREVAMVEELVQCKASTNVKNNVSKLRWGAKAIAV